MPAETCPFHERRYLRYGRVAHLLDAVGGVGTYQVALCVRVPALCSAWLGTGSQAEYERAAELPLCQDCERLHDCCSGAAQEVRHAG
ncbi:MAG: hypothetical protein ACREXX_13940 [Gammaproteobacteria bacterium]